MENQKLIAAAPELLKALEEQTNWFIACHLPLLTSAEQLIWWREIGFNSTAIIAKAKGETL